MPPVSRTTVDEDNALEQALSYLRTSSFSYTGLIEQLEYHGYTHDEAVYAADNCGANWYEQSLKATQSYLRTSAFSYNSLVEQLEFAGYSHDEAVYGADNCGADWNEQAAKSAQSYISVMSFSREELISQLEYSGFTPEQAAYGASAVGYSVPYALHSSPPRQIIPTQQNAPYSAFFALYGAL